MCNCLEKVELKGDFPPFIFCPYCGEKIENPLDNLSEEEKEQMVQEDIEAFEHLYQLEKILEKKFDDTLVVNQETLFEALQATMAEHELVFEISLEEKKIDILHRGHFQTHSIEVFLEPEDEDEPNSLYTVSVF